MMDARFPDGSETRAALELRVAGRRLEGYAAVFDQPTNIGSFTEVIRAGATRNSVAGGQIIALADHDPTRLLARQSSGTLRLAEDTRGLHFDLSLPDTSVGRDMLELATRGDIGGASIGFRAVQEAWPTANSRELYQIALSEISIVSAHPAYSQTSVSARARALGQHEAARRLRLLAIMGVV